MSATDRRRKGSSDDTACRFCGDVVHADWIWVPGVCPPCGEQREVPLNGYVPPDLLP